MSHFFGTAKARRALEDEVKEIPKIQETLVKNDGQLKMPVTRQPVNDWINLRKKPSLDQYFALRAFLDQRGYDPLRNGKSVPGPARRRRG
jgi:hypothetical protein